MQGSYWKLRPAASGVPMCSESVLVPKGGGCDVLMLWDRCRCWGGMGRVGAERVARPSCWWLTTKHHR